MRLLLLLLLMTVPSAASADPISMAAVSAAFSTYAAGSFATFSIGGFFARFALSLAMSSLSKAFAPKPPKGGTGGTTVATRQSASTHKYVYGQTRISDVYARIESAGKKNKFIYFIIILAAHEATEIGEIWVDDYCIPPDWLDADGMVTTGRYAEVMWIRKHLGSPTQTADTMLMAELTDYTDTHRLRGLCHLVVKMKYDTDIYPSGEPNISAIIKGLPLSDPRTGTTTFSSNTILFANDYIRSATYGPEALPEDMDDTNISTEASIADEIVDTTDKDMTVGLNTDTELDTGSSPAYTAVNTSTDIICLTGTRLHFELGDRVEIVSSNSPATLPGGLAALTDYYVIPYQFKTDPRIRLATSLANAMSNTYIDITSEGSGTITVRKNGEPRYHGAMVMDTATPHEEVLQGMQSAFAGRCVNIGGLWTLLSGAWRAPTVTFDENDFRQRVLLRTAVPIAERYNVIKGLYVSSQNDYQASDYPVVKSQTYIDEDAGREYPKDQNLPATNRSDTAQRIALIDLLRARKEFSVQVATSLKALQVQPGDVISIDFATYGFSAMSYEVMTFSLSVAEDGKEILVNLTLRQTAETVYTWTAADAQQPTIAPPSTLPDPFVVETVTGLVFSSQQIETRDADVLFELSLSWDEHPNEFVVEGGQFELQYKLSADEDYLPSLFPAGDKTSSSVTSSSVNVSYDMRIRAINNLGVRGEWTTIEGVTAGSSGGVGTTSDWQTFQDTVGSSADYQTFQDTVGSSNDWGYFV